MSDSQADGGPFTAYDSYGDEVARATDMDSQEDDSGRTLREKARDNEGWIEDATGLTVYDSQDGDE